MKIFSLLLGLFVSAIGSSFTTVSWAKTPSTSKTFYPAQKISLRGIQDVQVIGVRGRLKLKGRPKAKSLNLSVHHSKGKQFEDWQLTVDRRGKTLFLEVVNLSLGPKWRSEVRSELWPEFDIELDGKSMPITVSWRDGAMDISNWTEKLQVSFLNGPIHVRGGRESLQLQAVDGTVTVEDHQGDLSVSGEKGRVRLANITGQLNLRWLNGEIALQDVQGKVSIESQSGQLRAHSSGGLWNVGWPDGRVEIENFNGKLEGRGQSSRWDIKAKAPADVNVTTRSGAVLVQWLSGGNKVFLTSSTGTIEVPKPLSMEVREGLRVVEGSRTGERVGQIFVKTESGSIVLKQ